MADTLKDLDGLEDLLSRSTTVADFLQACYPGVVTSTPFKVSTQSDLYIPASGSGGPLDVPVLPEEQSPLVSGEKGPNTGPARRSAEEQGNMLYKDQMRRAPRWKPSLSSYEDPELRALRFSSEAEIDRAIEVVGSDPALREAPRDYADGTTMIVPTELAQVLRDRKLRFKESRLVDAANLSGAEVAAMRRRFGI